VIHGFQNDGLEPVYMQVMLGRGRPEAMGYADDELYRAAPRICGNHNRVPGEGRDPLFNSSAADWWVPAFAGNTD
jgi:hypothetical protein